MYIYSEIWILIITVISKVVVVLLCDNVLMLELHSNDMRCLFPAQDGDDMTDMGDTDGDDWMNVSHSHKLYYGFITMTWYSWM